jgi:uroporphyrinogen decarboxylase
MKITHRQRIETLLSGSEVDQLPVAFWRHFPMDDQNPNRLAASTIHFQDTFGMDIIKVSPSSSFCLKDWGIQDEWIGNTEGTRDYKSSHFKSSSDIRDLPILDPKNGFLGNQLKTLSILSDYYYPHTPMIQTIFSPLSQLKNLLGKNYLINAIRNDPKSVKIGLETITESIIRFLRACVELNIDGIFFAVQHASSDLLSKEEFIEFGKSFDERLFPSFQDFWINILHIHGKNIYFDSVFDYPLNIINWHDRDTYPDLKTAAKLTSKTFCGGLNRIHTMVRGNENTIKREIDDAVAQTDKKNLVLGTGCVLPIITPYGNIKYALDYARSL